jgi:transcriptional regulator with XRE-family HTH domain
MNSEISFGDMVKSRRAALGMSQAALAELIGRSASSIRSWERNSSTPSDEAVVQSLSAVLGIDEDDLRKVVGLPPIGQDDSETVGGAALEAFASEAEDTTAEAMAAAVVPAVDEPTEGPAGESERGTAADSEGEFDEATIDTDLPGPAPATDDEARAESPEELVREPADETGEPVAVPAASESEATVVEPATSGVASARSARAQVAEQPPAPAARSYLEDPDQMMTYWIRAALTVAFTVFLLIVLFWALGRLGDSLGEVWEIFKTGA